MSKFLYLAPFALSTIAFSGERKLNEILTKAKQPTTESLDDVPLRNRQVSDELGFVKLNVRFERYADYDEEDVIAELMTVAQLSSIRGIRGQRAVILDEDYTVNHIPGDYCDHNQYQVTLWVGSNIWFNKHRITSGFPGTEAHDVRTFLNALVSDLENDGFYNVYAEIADDTADDEARERAEAASNKLYGIERQLAEIAKGNVPVSEIQDVVERLAEISEELAGE